MGFVISGNIRPSGPCKRIKVRCHVDRFELCITDDHIQLRDSTTALNDIAWLDAQDIAKKIVRLLSLKLGPLSVEMSQACDELPSGARSLSARVACFIPVADSAEVTVNGQDLQKDSKEFEQKMQRITEWAVECLPLGDNPTFLRSLAYFEEALSKKDDCLPKLCKVIELLQKYFGGEAATGKALAMFNEIKLVKRLGNDAFRDERHSPGPDEKVVKPSELQKMQAVEITRRLIEAYLTYIREKEGKPATS